jgi:hypothetical protein
MAEEMSDQKQIQLLMMEYQINTELWKHDDNLRQQRNGVFLNLNSLLLVALGALITFKPSFLVASINAVLISIFGFPICLIWYFVQLRNSEYIKFRRYQLRSIEAQLGYLTTYSNQWSGLNKGLPVTFKGIQEHFNISALSKQTSTKLEGNLPLIIAIFWLFVFVLGIIILLFSVLGGI